MSIIGKNISMRNCLILAAPLLLAAALPSDAVAGGPARSVVRADHRTGRLVRRIIAPPAARNKAHLDSLVEHVARKHQLDPLLVRSVIHVESNYNPFAVSPKGAQGLMQLIPQTARRFGVANPFDPGQNIEGGVRYLKYLKDLFGNERLALAAYNAGEAAVLSHRNNVPPFPETLAYVRRVGDKYNELKRRPAPDSTAAPTPQYRPLETFIDSQGRLHLRTR